MQAAFANRSEDVYTTRYTHQLAHIEDFMASDKGPVKAQWCALSLGLKQSLYPETPTALLPFRLCP